MDGAGPIQFAISTPQVDVADHIAHALSLSLPEADNSRQALQMVANGPSARSATFLPDIPTMAVNGALRLFTAQSKAPDYWIACDPQECVLDFLEEIPESTIYLVASKCHPSVFERLKGRDVRLWHVNDHPIPNVRLVPCAVSVTICALLLAQRLGFRSIDVWGWDCCFDGDEHHAATGGLPATPERIFIDVGDGDPERWVSNPSWAVEVNDAIGVLPVLRWAGVDVRIYGRSMLAAILPEYAAI